VPEIDPYGVLGVPRAASRDEIARAYRSLAKRYHPDAGAEPTPTMGRINEAWNILSDPARRARWDRQHRVVEPPHWAPVPAGGDEPGRRPPPQPKAPPSRMDSPWLAAGVVAGVAMVVGTLMVGVSLASAPPDDRATFTSTDLEMRYPAEWKAAAGAPDQPEEHRVIGHFLTFPAGEDELCTTWGVACTLEAEEIPAGEASVLVIGRSGGAPPVPEPVTTRPYGLDADDMIGGQPAAIERHTLGPESTEMWWQLSPPGFPDRWIEVHAVIAGLGPEQDEVLGKIQQMLDSLEFRSGEPSG
jgi:hypothetical protein